MSREFKVGDRVVLREPMGFLEPYRGFGKKGRVATIENLNMYGSTRALIRFDYRGKPDKRGLDLVVRFGDIRLADEPSP